MYPPPSASADYMDRRRKLGYDMYSLMGIDRQDKAKRAAAMLENFDFFGAPVGLIVTVDRIVDKNGWGHVGCLLQVQQYTHSLLFLSAHECITFRISSAATRSVVTKTYRSWQKKKEFDMDPQQHCAAHIYNARNSHAMF